MQGLRPKRHQVFLAVVEEDLDTFFLQKTLAPAGFEWRVTRYNLHSLTATIWRTHDCLAWDPRTKRSPIKWTGGTVWKS